MKFEKLDNKEFQPFKIIVETEAEAQYLYALVGATDRQTDDLFGFDGSDLFDYLQAQLGNAAYDVPLLDITEQK